MKYNIHAIDEHNIEDAPYYQYKALMLIANELAEKNRLKRVEIRLKQEDSGVEYTDDEDEVIDIEVHSDEFMVDQA